MIRRPDRVWVAAVVAALIPGAAAWADPTGASMGELSTGAQVAGLRSAAGAPEAFTPLWREPEPARHADDTIRTSAQQYAAISFSVIGPDSGIAAVFDELGPPTPSLWRFSHWLPSSASYTEAGSGLSTVSRGLGYWLITRDAATIAYSGLATPPDTFRLDLSRGPGDGPGWNQVGNPFSSPIDVGTFKLEKRDTLALFAGPANSFAEHQVKIWNGATASYAAAATIPPNTAFWVRVIDPDPAPRWTRWTAARVNHLNAVSLAMDGHGLPYVGIGIVGAVQIDLRPYEIYPNFWGYVYSQPPAAALQSVSVAVDAHDQPHVAYAGTVAGTPGLAYAAASASGFHTELLDHDTGDGAYCSLALDAEGLPHILYSGAANTSLKYGYRVSPFGPWTVEGVESRPIYGCSMALDAHGFARMAYLGRNPLTGSDELRFASRSTSGSLSFRTVDRDVGRGASLALDAKGAPHICYEGPSGELEYASYDWVTWTFEAIGSGTQGRRPSLAIDGQGVAHVSYFAASDRTLRHAARTAGGWAIETVDGEDGSGEGGSAIAVDHAGRLHVAYAAGPTGNILRFATRKAGTVRLLMPLPGTAVAPPTPPALRPLGIDWLITLQAVHVPRASEQVAMGSAPGTPEERRALRSSLAPGPPGVRMLRMAIVPKDPGESPTVADFRAPGEETSWNLELEGLDSGEEAVLTARVFDLPADLQPWLSDLDHGGARLLTTGLPVAIAGGALPRRFRLDVLPSGTEPSPIATDGFRGAYPNPFPGRVGLLFWLTAPGDVVVDVFDLAGRHVRALARRGAPAGEQLLAWDGSDNDGKPLPAGLYLARYRAGGREGRIRLVKLD